jgi:pimeloyl-ACP methyl ester carboxylesterase
VSAFEVKSETLHGRSVSYAEAGAGPVLLLIHGMAGNFENWREVIEPLARDHTVIAPDLPAYGESAPGAGDYSIGALAAGLRDLLLAARGAHPPELYAEHHSGPHRGGGASRFAA